MTRMQCVFSAYILDSYHVELIFIIVGTFAQLESKVLFGYVRFLSSLIKVEVIMRAPVHGEKFKRRFI